MVQELLPMVFNVICKPAGLKAISVSRLSPLQVSDLSSGYCRIAGCPGSRRSASSKSRSMQMISGILLALSLRPLLRLSCFLPCSSMCRLVPAALMCTAHYCCFDDSDDMRRLPPDDYLGNQCVTATKAAAAATAQPPIPTLPPRPPPTTAPPPCTTAAMTTTVVLSLLSSAAVVVVAAVLWFHQLSHRDRMRDGA